MKTYLEVKIASLAAEARIIRKKERAALTEARYLKKQSNPENSSRYQLYYELNAHRTRDVRNEARSALLALGYLKGKLYHAMERKCYLPPNWGRVADLVRKYGEDAGADRKDIAERLKAWSEASELVRA